MSSTLALAQLDIEFNRLQCYEIPDDIKRVKFNKLDLVIRERFFSLLPSRVKLDLINSIDEFSSYQKDYKVIGVRHVSITGNLPEKGHGIVKMSHGLCEEIRDFTMNSLLIILGEFKISNVNSGEIKQFSEFCLFKPDVLLRINDSRMTVNEFRMLHEKSKDGIHVCIKHLELVTESSEALSQESSLELYLNELSRHFVSIHFENIPPRWEEALFNSNFSNQKSLSLRFDTPDLKFKEIFRTPKILHQFMIRQQKEFRLCLKFEKKIKIPDHDDNHDEFWRYFTFSDNFHPRYQSISICNNRCFHVII